MRDNETVIRDASHLLPPGRRCRYCGWLDPDTREMCNEAPASVLYHATADGGKGVVSSTLSTKSETGDSG